MVNDRTSAELSCDAADEGDLGRHLGTLLRAYQSMTAVVLGNFPQGMRGYQILSAVVHDDQPNQVALAGHLGIDRTVMTYLIDDLVNAGLVERQQNPADRRARRIVVTDLGAKTLSALQAQVHAAEQHLLAALTAAEQASFRGLLRRAACDIREVGAETDLCAVVADITGESKPR